MSTLFEEYRRKSAEEQARIEKMLEGLPEAKKRHQEKYEQAFKKMRLQLTSQTNLKTVGKIPGRFRDKATGKFAKADAVNAVPVIKSSSLRDYFKLGGAGKGILSQIKQLSAVSHLRYGKEILGPKGPHSFTIKPDELWVDDFFLQPPGEDILEKYFKSPKVADLDPKHRKYALGQLKETYRVKTKQPYLEIPTKSLLALKADPSELSTLVLPDSGMLAAGMRYTPKGMSEHANLHMIMHKNVLIGTPKLSSMILTEPTDILLPEQLGGGYLHKPYAQHVGGLTQEVTYGVRRLRPADDRAFGISVRSERFDALQARNIRAAVAGKEGIARLRATKSAVRSTIEKYGFSSSHPYAGVLKHYYGRYFPSLDQPDVTMMDYVTDIMQKERPEFIYGLPSERIEGTRFKAGQISDLIWDRGLFPTIIKPESILKESILSIAPTGAILPFGGAADITRDIQMHSGGLFVSEILDQPWAKMGLAGGRTWEPYVTTPMDRILQERAMELTGVPTQLQARYGMITRAIDPTGTKFIPGEHLISAEMADALLSPEMAEKLRLDISGRTTLMDPTVISRTGIPGVTPRRHQTPFFLGSAKWGGHIAEGLGTGEFADYDVVTGFYNWAKKYPHDYQKMYVETTMERLARFLEQEETIVRKFTGAKGVRELAETKDRIYRSIYDVLHRDLDFADIDPGAGFQKYMASTIWAEEGGPKVGLRYLGKKQDLPQITIGPKSFVGSRTMEALQDIFTRELGDPDIFKPGFEIEYKTLPSGTTLEMAKIVTGIKGRADDHALQGVKNLAKIARTPYSMAGVGTKVSDTLLHHLEMSPLSGTQELHRMLQDIVLGQPTDPVRRATDFTQMLSTMSLSEETVRRTTPLGANRIDEKVFQSIESFQEYLSSHQFKNLKIESIGDAVNVFDVKTYAASELYDKRVRIRLKTPMTVNIGEQAVTLSELVLPRIKPTLEPALHEYLKTQEIFSKPDLYKHLETFYTDVQHGRTHPKNLANTLSRIYETEITSMLKKEGGALKQILSPRLTGSGYFGFYGAWERDSVAGKIIKELGAQAPQLEFGEVALHPRDIIEMGGKQALRMARKGELHGLTVTYPMQSPMNILGPRIVAHSGVERGHVLGTLATSLIGFRDHDFDRIGLVINPFGRSNREFKEFNQALKKYNLDVTTLYAAAYKTPEWQSIVEGGEAELNRYKQALDPTAFAKQQRQVFTDLRHRLAVADQEGILKAYAEASDDATGWLHAFIDRRNKNAKELFKVQLDAKLATQAGTGHISNVMKSLNIASMELQREEIAHLASRERIGIEEAMARFKDGIGAKRIFSRDPFASVARTQFNFSILMGILEQEAIQKGQVAAGGAVTALEHAFSKKASRSQLLDMIQDVTGRTLEAFDTLDSPAGPRFIISDQSTEPTRIAAMQEDLTDYTMRVLRRVRQTGRRFGQTPAMGVTYDPIKNVRRLLEETATLDPSRTPEGPLGNIMRGLGLTEAATETKQTRLRRQKRKAQQDVLDDSKQVKNTLETIKEQGEVLWKWFSKKPDVDKRFGHYAKRGGIVAAVGLVGLGLARNLLSPGFVPPERPTSYVDMSPPYSKMNPPRPTGSFENNSGNMPAVYSDMGPGVANPNHPVMVGAGMRYNAPLGIDQHGEGMANAPLPPASNVGGYAYGDMTLGKDVLVHSNEARYANKRGSYNPVVPQELTIMPNNINPIEYQEIPGQTYNIDYNRKGGPHSLGTYIERHQLV